MKNTTTLQSKRSITVLLGVLLYFSSLSAQTMQDTIIANFSLMERIPKEKLYLHLDKPFYGAGEKIWFKGYLVNVTTHQDNSQSNFIIGTKENPQRFSRIPQRLHPPCHPSGRRLLPAGVQQLDAE